MDKNYALFRFQSGKDATLGALFALTELPAATEPSFRCFTCEDESRPVKVKGETRIPAGRYEIKLRAAGGMHPKYASKFPGLHRGMLHLQDVPGFEWVYIHIGNDDDDTAGCILVGDGAHVGGTLSESTVAYRRLYGVVSNAILAGEPVSIEVRDI